MQFSFFTITTLLASAGISLAAPAPAPAILEARATITVKYENRYDNRGGDMNTVSCSDGHNGLITRKKWNTFGRVSTFPFVGGWEGVKQWNSPKCGQCLLLSYRGKSYKFTAIDSAQGITISETAMNIMTGGRARQYGKISVGWKEVRC